MVAANPLIEVRPGLMIWTIICFLVVLFVLVHLAMVLLSGVWNNLRSMITGRYVIEPAEEQP